MTRPPKYEGAVFAFFYAGIAGYAMLAIYIFGRVVTS